MAGSPTESYVKSNLPHTLCIQFSDHCLSVNEALEEERCTSSFSYEYLEHLFSSAPSLEKQQQKQKQRQKQKKLNVRTNESQKTNESGAQAEEGPEGYVCDSIPQPGQELQQARKLSGEEEAERRHKRPASSVLLSEDTIISTSISSTSTSTSSSSSAVVDEGRENSNKKGKKRANLPKEVTRVLRAWLIANLEHPYPTEDEKNSLSLLTNLEKDQVNNWFTNARRRLIPQLIQEKSEDRKLSVEDDGKEDVDDGKTLNCTQPHS